VYEECLCHELQLWRIAFQQQVPLPVHYKGLQLPHGHRLDLLVDNTVVVGLKAIETLLPVHKAQLLSYLRLGNWPLGLPININEARLVDGLRRITLSLPGP
jgi:GxxExxY protein